MRKPYKIPMVTFILKFYIAGLYSDRAYQSSDLCWIDAFEVGLMADFCFYYGFILCKLLFCMVLLRNVDLLLFLSNTT